MTLNMALELRTDRFGIGCDGLRPLLREGIFVPAEVFFVKKR